MNFGLKYYSDPSRSPISKLVAEKTEFKGDAPLILFTDSSWQDCPDTGRSTGGYYLYQQGEIVDGGCFLPTPVAMSSAEAEYNALAHAMQCTSYTRQVIHKINGNHPDSPLSIPLFCDSQSALTIGENNKDTKRTRHIQRRVHYVRDNIASGNFEGHKIPGEFNPADVGTKNLTSDVLEIHREVMHVQVSP